MANHASGRANCDGPIVCFGEILIRLSAPDHELLLQSPRLAVHIGGAEANVAVSLSRLGRSARMASFLPDNELGRAARDELRRHGVDVSGVRFASGRMGLYFLTPGAMLRPSEVIYDRAGSAFAEASANAIDWRSELADASMLHLSGITPALGANARNAALLAAQAARDLGIGVSFDGNYRARLWGARGSEAPAALKALLSTATIAFVDDRDIALVLGRTFEEKEQDRRRRTAAKAAFDAFPRLERIASTYRVQHSVDKHDLSAALYTRRGDEFVTEAQRLVGFVDRIGAGDAFAAGLLHGLRTGMDDRGALEFAKAAACLKHGIPGDFNLVREADVVAFLTQDSLDVRR